MWKAPMNIKTLPQVNDPENPPRGPLEFAQNSRDSDVLQLVRDALQNRRARLAFQRVVLSRDPSKTAFFEGLIRVMDEKGRVIPAGHFMPVVEEHDLGRQLDAATLDLAFKMLRANPGQRLSVNVSARSLGDSRWRRVLEAGLQEGGSLGDRLIFEISETSAMMLHEVVVAFMQEMQPRGVCFALDGFGGGVTAFRHLRAFMFDLVKIDKSFARGVATDADNQVLVEALVMVAHRFEMFAVIEGVENEDDAQFLQGVGADCLQGFHFGPPKFALR